jgi:tetratricopeptide (TPR) repeat protein
MSRLVLVLLALLCANASFAQPAEYATREQALRDLSAPGATQRAGAVIWIAEHGTQADSAALARRLADKSAQVREITEQALWRLWFRSDDDEIDLLMQRGAVQMQAQKLKEAIATYSEVIRRKPEFAEGWNRRATALFVSGEYAKSLADCDEVIKRNPQHFGALAGYGHVYFALERYDEAIAWWRRALAVNPNMAGVLASIEGAEKLLAERRKRMI